MISGFEQLLSGSDGGSGEGLPEEGGSSFSGRLCIAGGRTISFGNICMLGSATFCHENHSQHTGFHAYGAILIEWIRYVFSHIAAFLALRSVPKKIKVIKPQESVPSSDMLACVLLQGDETIQSKSIEMAVAADSSPFYSDRTRTKEVFTNLLDVSLKYMGDESHPRVDIGQKKSGMEEIFYVKDNGIGIDLSLHERIFGPFYNIEKQTSKTVTGLTIVRSIIEVHSGQSRIDFELCEGTIVLFNIPLAKKEAS